MTTSQNTIKRKIVLYGLVIVVSFLILATYAYAETPEYKPLVGLPKLQTSGARSLPEYINAVYLLTIGLGALLGVIKISMAGVKYSLSEIAPRKSDAKEEIKGVLFGLALLLVPFIVLNTINPELTSLDILKIARENKVNIVDGGSQSSSDGSGAKPTSGSVTEWVWPNATPDPKTGKIEVTDEQAKLLESTCKESGGSLSFQYGCLKNNKINCSSGEYFSEAFKKCVPQ